MFNTEFGVFNFDSFVPGISVCVGGGQTVPINFKTLTVNGTTTTRYLVSAQIAPAPVPLPPSIWLMVGALSGLTPATKGSRSRNRTGTEQDPHARRLTRAFSRLRIHSRVSFVWRSVTYANRYE